MTRVQETALEFIKEQPGITPTQLAERFRYETTLDQSVYRGVCTGLAAKGLVTIDKHWGVYIVEEKTESQKIVEKYAQITRDAVNTDVKIVREHGRSYVQETKRTPSEFAQNITAGMQRAATDEIKRTLDKGESVFVIMHGHHVEIRPINK